MFRRRSLLEIGSLILFLVVAAALLVLGRTLYRRGRSSILRDRSCSPPCWHQITPGVSTSWQVYEVLIDLEGVGAGSIREWPPNGPTEQMRWIFRSPVTDAGGDVHLRDDRVTAISIQTFGSLTAQEAIQKLGEPTSFWCRREQIGARRRLEVDLMYPTRGYAVEVDVDLPADPLVEGVKLWEDSPVRRIVYFDPLLYESLLQDRTLSREEAQAILENQHAWAGFGLIRLEEALPYPPR